MQATLSFAIAHHSNPHSFASVPRLKCLQVIGPSKSERCRALGLFLMLAEPAADVVAETRIIVGIPPSVSKHASNTHLCTTPSFLRRRCTFAVSWTHLQLSTQHLSSGTPSSVRRSSCLDALEALSYLSWWTSTPRQGEPPSCSITGWCGPTWSFFHALYPAHRDHGLRQSV